MSGNPDLPGHLQDEIPIDYFDDVNIDPGAVSGTTIERLTLLQKTWIAKDAERAKLAVALAELEEELKGITRVQLPSIMEELGVAEFKMEDGSAISIIDKVNASIPEAQRPAAFQWLEDHNYDAIIKTKVLAEFGKGEMEDAKSAQRKLEEIGVFASLDRSVHNATLTSFVKERLQAGEKLPDSFSVFEFKEAKIKPAKVKKAK